MALRLFRCRSLVAKNEVAEERPQGHRDHDPSVVSHEDQPAITVSDRLPNSKVVPLRFGRARSDSHEHECVECLRGVHDGLYQLDPPADLCLVPSCGPRQRRRLSSEITSGLKVSNLASGTHACRRDYFKRKEDKSAQKSHQTGGSLVAQCRRRMKCKTVVVGGGDDIASGGQDSLGIPSTLLRMTIS